ncbi:MAG: hypothetical protein LKG23_06585 [Nitrospira sp.]|jgi:hypothetical protein|nr:hypothetical protein [Nitrospira sp.]
MKAQENHHCVVCEPKHHERNNYYYGKQFTVRDLQLEQHYFLGKMALTNRAILGWGVVCGLNVEICDHTLTVQPGLAIDCCGRQVMVCEPFTMCLESLTKECPGRTYALCLEYTECLTEEIKLPPDECDGGDRHENNRIRDHYRIRLKPWEDKCHARRDDYLPCPDHLKHPASQDPEPQCPPPTLHSHLCHHLECHNCDCCACVVLGQVKLSDPPAIDACTHRRIVYNNSMLFKLIECYHGDLAHIVDFNWRKKTHGTNSRRVSWEWFSDLMREGLTVEFDHMMDPRSLSRHTFIVTLTFADPDSGRIRTERVPPEKKPVVERHENCSRATFYASTDWLDDERKLSALRNGFGVEIILRGSNIYTDNSNGQPRKALDGDFIGEQLPTGDGTPGGDFFDWFQVEAWTHKPVSVQEEEY